MKLAWNLLKHPKELWAEVIISKYMKKVNGSLVPRGSKRFSPLWRGIRDAWEPMNKGIQWSLNNGRDTRFWDDCWLDSGVRLGDGISNQVMGAESDKVADFVLDSGAWDIQRLEAILPRNRLQEVIGMTPLLRELGGDEPVWGLEVNGQFSIKSAYLLLLELRRMEGSGVWSSVWKWPGPTCIRHFIWLATQGKLLTNEERRRRHISNDGSCRRCGAEVEDVEHILRACPVAVEVWQSLLPQQEAALLLNHHWDSWFSSQLSHPKNQERDWETKIVHVYREANHLADCLAARGHDIDTGATLRLEDDPVIRRWENYDARGVTERRTITGMC
ncbi:Putative ribonuclease H protein At1g65750 [Linum perenne]